MNNQQAINLLKGLEQSLDDYCELNDEGKTAFGMAITALELFGNSEQLPPAQPELPDTNVGDPISRQAAIDALDKRFDSIPMNQTTEILLLRKDLRELPSAQQEIIRCKDCKHGVDYYHEGNCYCSNPKWGLQYFGGSWEFYCADAERRTDG